MVSRIIRRLRTLRQRERAKDDIRREIDFHIEMETEVRARRGMDPLEARRTALRDFGGDAGVGADPEGERDDRAGRIASQPAALGHVSATG